MKLFLSTLVSLSVLFSTNLQAEVNQHFNKIKEEPQRLYSFLKAMPKGGELHYHLAGGAYPEAMMSIAANKRYCLDSKKMAVSPKQSPCQTIDESQLKTKPGLKNRILAAWSMQGFKRTLESGHDHFFNTFGKFMPVVSNHNARLLVDILKRAANQHVLYMEIMILPDDAQSARFGKDISKVPSLAEKRRILLADKQFIANAYRTAQQSDKILMKARQLLGCDKQANQAACQITVKFQYYVLREQPLDAVFAQSLNGFLANQLSHNLVGVNLVQAEDGPISLRDYQDQMRIFHFMHLLYPQVHIALHAGELAAGQVAPEHLRFHIREALNTGKAERIGHGAAILHEDDWRQTMDMMATHHRAVEINLSSNQAILGVGGQQHPLKTYLEHKVPVVLSTDDEGILRTNLTEQYLLAVSQQGLDYQTLKQINRNALTYSFMPGKSLWQDPAHAVPVKACREMGSYACQQFIQRNPKAQLQWRLEQQLIAFEKRY